MKRAMTALTIRRRTLLVAAAMALTGCAAGPDFERPAAPEGARYQAGTGPRDTVAALGERQHFDTDATLPADWWRQFGSPALDRLVEQALAHSPTADAARAALLESEDDLRAGLGLFYPSMAIEGAAARERSSPALQGQTASHGSVFKLLTLSGSVSYTIDLFGHDRRVVEGFVARRDEADQRRRAAYLSLSANVVTTALARAAYAEQLQLEEDLLALQERQLALDETQVRAGIAGFAVAAQQAMVVDATSAEVAALRQRQSQSAHLLAALVGCSPGELPPNDIRLAALHLPTQLPLVLPSGLVRWRPDILVAEAQLHQASAAIGVATADLYPHISLTGSYGGASDRFGSLSQANGRFWSVGPNVSLPVFAGGSLVAARDAALEAYRQALDQYRQTVLNAFAQVADSLDALGHDARQLQADGDAARLAADQLALLRANEGAGLVAGTDVLAADIALHQAEVVRLGALAQRQQDTVALFAAVGGGWQVDPAARSGGGAP